MDTPPPHQEDHPPLWTRPLGALLGVVLVSSIITVGPGCVAPQPLPSVVLLTLDTLNRNYTPMGGRTDLMPALADLLTESVSFPVAHTQVPLTLPSHISMFTGQAPLDHGVLLNSVPVPEDIPLLAEQMRDAGYETAAFVSFGVLGPETGVARGFETYDTGTADPHRYRRAPDTLSAVQRFLAARDRRTTAPLFLWVHLVDPHLPYLEREPLPDLRILSEDGAPLAELTLADQALHRVELPPGTDAVQLQALSPVTQRARRRLEILEVLAETDDGSEQSLLGEPLRLRARRPTQRLAVPAPRAIRLRGVLESRGQRDLLRRYESEVRLMDEGIGALRHAIAQELGDEALWAILSDHGEGCFEHEANGHAAHAWEEQLAVLFALRPPPSWTDESPVPERLPRAQVEDLTPTLLDLLGLDRPDFAALSHADCILTGTNCRSRSRWAAYAAKRDGRLSAAAVYDWPLKVVWRTGEGARCHDLTADPDELVPLSPDDPGCAAQVEVVDEFRSVVTPMLTRGGGTDGLTADQRRMLETLGYL